MIKTSGWWGIGGVIIKLVRGIGFPILILLVAIVLRGLMMELTDLVDPTESRYAVVAQLMVIDHDWLTPKLPYPEGVVPYLGKPPLHFWLTALCYSVFGFDEWVSRLPSLIDQVVVLLAVIFFCFKVFDFKRGLLACLICLTAGVPYFLAGASVVDTTLAALVTVGTAFLYLGVLKDGQNKHYSYLAGVFGALSFLTKGPVGVVLIWLPLFFWSLVRRDFSWTRKFPWLATLSIFLLISAPWFILSEIENPGFLKYFFWNENLARYIYSEYGDKYGSGHTHIYGASWVMLLGMFAPWILVPLYFAGEKLFGKKVVLELDGTNCFLLCWALAAPIFFTFIRQLHIMYLLPAAAPLAILTANLLSFNSMDFNFLAKIKAYRVTKIFYLLTGILLIGIGMVLEFELLYLALSLLLLAAGYFFITLKLGQTSILNNISYISGHLAIIYLIAISSLSAFISTTRSSEIALVNVAHQGCKNHQSGIHQVGMDSRNSFSLFWLNGAWKNELEEQVQVRHVTPELASDADICHYLVKSHDRSATPESIKNDFEYTSTAGDWLIYSKKGKG